MSFAVIDIGSGSVRMLFGGKKTTVMTKLGEGLSANGVLSEAAMTRTVNALKDLVQTARMSGARVAAFATEAVRAANNRGEFLGRVQEECGITVEIVSGFEEAEIALLGACPRGAATVVDIGGASVEIISGTDGVKEYAQSLPLGMVRLTEQAGRSPELMRVLSARGLSKYGKIPLHGVIGVGGTFTSLAAMALGLKTYDPARVQGFVLTKADVARLTEELVSLDSPEAIAKKYPVLPTVRCELITAGAVFVTELYAYLGIDAATVSEADNLDGYARYKKLM